jgi:Sporulation related domain.
VPNTAVPEAEPNVKVIEPGSEPATAPARVKTPAKASAKKTEPAVKAAAPGKSAAVKPAEKQAAQPVVPKTVKKQPAVTQFWVQAAAFTSKKTADDARATLDSNKIPADVFTYKDNRGRMFYRVRIGPYMTKSEAEYWRTRIAMIPEFAKNESYVTSTLTVQ